MRFFFLFFLLATALCAYFWATDAPGSGMVWPTCIFAALGTGTGAYNFVRNGSPLNDNSRGK